MNNSWIPYPLVLEGNTVKLVPLEEHHLEELYKASSDKELWRLVPTDCSDRDTFYANYRNALAARDKGEQYPFVILDKETNAIIGSTRFFEMYEADKKLEIGWTWITQGYWGTVVNLECKLLLLTYCFETLKVNRVQLKTKDDNIRSRKAIEKIGGIFEGVLRKDKIQNDGTTRNAAYYSILDNEWEIAKKKIQCLINR
ncbi:GNAT family N-acetyltransferase [Myroides marinus]|uniref:GNAT family acetyltransferase n=1 Tax=Myroides marinus TaxID=703342 RepID=A0A165R2R4_9FLAO|nr:GNAT family N-acetyltransferase [Myroides marinus]KZE78102.1 GNAT family acetyltransferase [Myroides marinus]MDM1380671.1 GNAT family N-acetyltransferase [Myroides marinus]MDM1387951.1 GNAT family N-acetyltransferase [Myroides marinus]MDM1395163.1 GNAT family N-acetyltransferase [Myroides marinus]